jgi:hypothetical protein
LKFIGSLVATDKKTAARRLIHNAIRQTIRGEDPLVVHVVSMCCYDLLREYAEAKQIRVSTNLLNKVPPKFLRTVIDAVKLFYRFSKHAKTDPDATIDETQIVAFADVVLLMVIAMFEECFGERTEHMKLYGAFMVIRYPDIQNPAMREAILAIPGYNALSTQTRGECRKDLGEIIQTNPDLRVETAADLSTLKAGEHYSLEKEIED